MTDRAASSSSMASALVQPDVGAPGSMAPSAAPATGAPNCQVVGKDWLRREFPRGRDDDPSERWAEGLDRALNYALSRVTLGLSPASVAEAYFDWLVHLTAAPGKQLQLCQKALRKTLRFWHYAATRALTEQAGVRCIEPLPHDKRFLADVWHVWPYNVIHQAFLLQQQWWHNATTGVPGVTLQHERQVEFATRQLLDVLSPANFVLTNPQVAQRTYAEGGQNLVRGFWNFVEDWERVVNGRKPVGADAFKVGDNLGVTPGKVIFRNRLIELIQYTPTTDQVRPEPVLIVPAWIMKYYILDLTPEQSLVKYLVDRGFTVFIISWRNPGPEDRDLSLNDYRVLGIGSALEVVQRVVPDAPVHGVGYCLGGTLLAIAAAELAGRGRDRFKTVTFLAAQVDFEEAGELTLFINESQVTFLEDMMWQQGVLDANQMAGAFQILHSNDLIWSRVIHDYLMGERTPMFDLMAWNADSTRMPYRMHSEYLRQLFLDNDLAEGRYRVDGRPVALTDIKAPVFAVGTETDHVAPWHSVFKLHLLLDTHVTFLLTSGGHNAGIVSEPARSDRHYRVRERSEQDPYLDPDAWVRETPAMQGSWWPAWVRWLAERSGAPVTAPALGGTRVPPLADAPGTYVLEP
ncbi:MAG TPA: alpha/beta fold hydrolase [Hyphomicrobiaceae bacterium]|nr:alpha/beta fold hydrolase [Hyphomicrobiaceae bacterium]